MDWHRAVCMKEIFWNGKTYRQHDPIRLTTDELKELSDAGVIGDIKQIPDIEFAVKSAPETAMKSHRRKK